MNYFDEDDESMSAQDLVLQEAGASPEVLRAVSQRALLQSTRPLGKSPYGGEVIAVTSPGAQRYLRDYERTHGSIPRDEKGRRYVVDHIEPLADGGSDTPDNMRLIPHDEHVRHHRENGDASRWGKRAGIARAFGGRVEKIVPRANMFSLPLGVLSGRIPLNDWGDMLGATVGAPFQQYYEENKWRFDPNVKPSEIPRQTT